MGLFPSRWICTGFDVGFTCPCDAGTKTSRHTRVVRRSLTPLIVASCLLRKTDKGTQRAFVPPAIRSWKSRGKSRVATHCGTKATSGVPSKFQSGCCCRDVAYRQIRPKPMRRRIARCDTKDVEDRCRHEGSLWKRGKRR